jgi:hypothetical protein
MAPGKIFFISEHAYQELIHGGVGPVDIETILIQQQAIPIRFPYHFDFSVKAKIVRFIYFLKICVQIEPGSVVIFQHPLYARLDKLLIRFLRLRRFKRIICIVDDIDGLKTGNNTLLQKEMSFFRRLNYFILHNASMLQWFKSFHPEVTASLLVAFDFLTKGKTYQRQKTNEIVFAGNLQKSGFLEKLDEWLEPNSSLHIHLYGPYVTDRMLISKRVTYKGFYHPYILPDILLGSFGLVWDGDGIEEPSGCLGKYMQYINHHKLSLYIVSNLPVIVHENTGSASLVRQFNIGFTVKTLFEIEEKINALSENEYQIMVENTRSWANDIASGNCLQKALSELLGKIEEKR